MRLVKPSWEFMNPTFEAETDGAEMLKRIERAGRVCYKSEAKITEESAPTFVRTATRWAPCLGWRGRWSRAVCE